MSLLGEHLSVRRGARLALSNATLRLAGGETVAIVGPNGAGKSTLLRALAGELPVETGRVVLNGRPIASLSPKTRAAERAVLGQEPRAAAPFVVSEIVGLGLQGRGLAATHGRGAEIVREALALMALEPLAQRRITELSGGEARRAHLARVFAQVWDPTPGRDRFVLLDEPTANLDLRHQHGVLAAARAFAREGAGVLVVLHDLDLAARYADRVVVMRDGRILADGPPAAACEPDLLSRAYEVPPEWLPAMPGASAAPAASASRSVA